MRRLAVPFPGWVLARPSVSPKFGMRNKKSMQTRVKLCRRDTKRSHQVLEIHIENVESARQLKNLTQKAISERLGGSRQPISKFFNGKPVSCELFVDICKILAVDWQEITGLKESRVGIAHLTESEKDTQKSEIDIEPFVNQLRQQVKADIETRCGTMRIFDMTQPIDREDLHPS